MVTSLRIWRVVVCSCLIASFAGLPLPAAQPNIAQQAPSTVETAAKLMQAGHLDRAKLLLGIELIQDPGNNQVLFLLGMIAVQQKKYDEAIKDFRRILDREPKAERVRLELARAFFLKKDYENSQRQFRFARAGRVPGAVKENIDHYLGAIKRLRRWQYSASLALAPDTNVNGSTSVRQVTIYGLPFELSSDARGTSGVGVRLSLGGEWSPLITNRLKMRLGGNVNRAEYGGGQFDDMTVSAYAGPQLLLPRWDISVLSTWFQRWYGNTTYAEGVGGRIEAEHNLSRKLDLLMGFSGQSVTYTYVPDQNGPVLGLDSTLAYEITPSTIVQLQGGVSRQEARLAPYANWSYWLSASYYQDLPHGFSIYATPGFVWSDYDEPLAAFGVKRNDTAVLLRAGILNRRISYYGFTPQLSYVHINQLSNIPLYRYERDQVEIGFTRIF